MRLLGRQRKLVMQLDPMQARLDELLRRLKSQESLVRTLQATQVPLNDDTQKAAWWTTQQQYDGAWWSGYESVDWSRLEPRLELLVECVLEQYQANEQSHDRANMERRRETL